MHGVNANKHRRLAGCVPMKGGGDQLQVMLITSRSHPDRLIFPKGGVKRDESPESAALRETWEEAGIRGPILDRLSPSHDDSYSDDEKFCCEETGSIKGVEMSERWEGRRNSALAMQACRWYVMEVQEEADEWPEKGQRSRLWYSHEEAQKLDNIKDNVRDLLQLLEEWNKQRSNQSIATPLSHTLAQPKPSFSSSFCQIS